jgi:hypothetical protein
MQYLLWAIKHKRKQEIARLLATPRFSLEVLPGSNNS